MHDAESMSAELVFLAEDGTKLIKTAGEWRKWLSERRWAVSGYGTVCDQTEPGIIPSLLLEWYNTRKEYQALKKKEDAAKNYEKANYYDRLQYVFKIKLNSVYGALTNLYFRFYDLRMGESTTATGRMILRHQCSMVNKLLTGEYDLHGEAVIYGDTDSTYFTTFAESVDEAVQVADAVAAKVNDSYSQFMRDAFLCTPGYDNIIKAAREIVSDKGIFITPKHYILHIVDKEGKKVDDLKVMGLDTKKTTIPREVGDTLNGFIGRLFKGETWQEISLSVMEYKRVLHSTSNIMSIGLPRGIKNVDKYTTAYEQDPNTRLPGHVAAAILYNKCIKEYNDKDSVPITSGMKIKVFYLTKRVGKFKSIALPTDTVHPPKWFLDNFEVDRDAHIERLVDNPLSNIITAIGEEVPTEHSMKVNAAWEF